jgi:hypothetical protein
MKNEVKKKMTKKLRLVDVRKSRERNSQAKVNENFSSDTQLEGRDRCRS